MTNSATLALTAPASPPRLALSRLVVIDVVLPLITVVVLLQNGAPPLAAYAAGSLFPVASIVVSWLSRRSVDYIGLGVLGGIAGALVMAVVTGDPRFGLMRAAPAFALFGAACLVSLAAKRPLMFFVARAFAAGDDAERNADWNARLAQPAFRQAMRRITALWGAGTLAHAVVNAAVAFLLPASVALILEPATAVATVAVLLAWSRAIARRNSPRRSQSEGGEHA